MRGRRAGRSDAGPSGFLVVDKPGGWTSHDVVDAARRWLGTRRVGHLGTLDPLATGVLPLAVRDATKLVPFVEGGRKAYEATLLLGAETDTLDADGRVTARHTGPWPEEAEVRAAVAEFVGPLEQTPPMYSAVKQGGVPLHRLARRGEEVERKPRRIEIFALSLVRYEPPDLALRVEGSAGTYVRVLAADLGRRLGCYAHVRALRRTASGPFTLAQAATVDALDRDADPGARLLSPLAVLGLPALSLEEPEARRVLHGGEIVRREGSEGPPGERVVALDPDGRLLAILERGPGGWLRPIRVLSRES